MREKENGTKLKITLFNCVHFKLPYTHTEMANHCCQDEETNKRSSNKIIISPSGSISLRLPTFFILLRFYEILFFEG